jgi:hypothetical protein
MDVIRWVIMHLRLGRLGEQLQESVIGYTALTRQKGVCCMIAPSILVLARNYKTPVTSDRELIDMRLVGGSLITESLHIICYVE